MAVNLSRSQSTSGSPSEYVLELYFPAHLESSVANEMRADVKGITSKWKEAFKSQSVILLPLTRTQSMGRVRGTGPE